MTKAMICVPCADIVAPYADYRVDHWRWCACGASAVRWRNSTTGLLEVTSRSGPDDVRVLGVNNMFLRAAVSRNPHTQDGSRTFEQWRALHDLTCAHVDAWYLFHKDKRNCWALIVRVGESSDVFHMDYDDARAEAP